MAPGISKKGRPKGTDALVLDVEECKRTHEELVQSEARFRALVENSSDLVAMVDRAGIFEFQSPSSEPILGYRPEEFIGQSVFSFIHPDDTDLSHSTFAQLVRGGRKLSESTEVRFRHKDGSWRVLEVRARELPGRAGGVSYVLNSRDVTDRRQVEESLKLAQFSVDHAGISMFWTDPDGRFVSVNDHACSRLGYSREELLTMRVSDIDPVAPHPWCNHWLELKEKGFLTFESIHCTKAGESFPILSSVNYVEFAGKEYNFGFAADITERKRAEEALRLAQLTVDRAGDLIQWVAGDGRIVNASESSCRRHGYSREEMLTKTIFDLDPNTSKEMWPEHFTALKERGSMTFESSHLTKGGDLFPVEVSANSVESGGEDLVFGFVRDITERRLAEEALQQSENTVRAILESVQMGILIIDPKTHTVVSVNPAGAEMIGAPREEIVGKVCLRCICPAEEGRCPVTDLGQAVDNSECVLLRADGVPIPVIKTVASLVLDGRPHLVESFVDISERKRAEEELKESEQQLRQAQKMEAVGQLAGGIAHDFNNLLTAIIGNSSLVLHTMSPEDPNRELILDVKEVGERAAGLTRQILAFSRRQILKPRVLQLNDIVVSMEPLLRRTLGEQIDLHFFLAPDLEEIEVDPHQMEQVLMNLALNARDAMPEGGDLTVETAGVRLNTRDARNHPEVEPGRYVMLAVSDTGRGMDEETRARVFEPFFTTKEVGKGTGLGLSTVFGTVKQTGGSISVQSEPGVGSTFRVYLPATQTLAVPKDDSPLEGEMERGTEAILVVEDEAPVRRLVAQVLSRAGYQVFQAGSIRDVDAALSQAKSPPALLLTDVVLPGGVNGSEVAEVLCQRYQSLKVLYMSGYTRDFVVHNGRLDEGIDFLEKPFTPETLLQKVRLVLDVRPSAIREA